MYRGLRDTKTPFYATVVSNVLNVAMVPVFMFTLGLGVKGAALATVLAQLLPCGYLLYCLPTRYGIKLTAAGSWTEVTSMFGPTGVLRCFGAVDSTAFESKHTTDEVPRPSCVAPLDAGQSFSFFCVCTRKTLSCSANFLEAQCVLCCGPLAVCNCHFCMPPTCAPLACCDTSCRSVLLLNRAIQLQHKDVML